MGNLIKKLPNLPNCEELECENNLIEELPQLPKCEEILLKYDDKPELFILLC